MQAEALAQVKRRYCDERGAQLPNTNEANRGGIRELVEG
jgi:hypothetical protein